MTELPEWADYSVSVTTAPLIYPDGKVVWQAVYWEIRNSGQGYQITDAIYDSGAWWHLLPPTSGPALGPDAVAERVLATEQQLRLMVPDEVADELLRHVTL